MRVYLFKKFLRRYDFWVAHIGGALIGVLIALLVFIFEPKPFFTADVGILMGALIGLLGVVYSTLVVALVLISNQFAPRAIISFIKSQSLHLSLAIFDTALAYTLAISTFRQTNQVDGGWLVIAGAIFSFFSFMFHIIRNINIAHIIEQIAWQTKSEIRLEYPQNWEELSAEMRHNWERDWHEERSPTYHRQRHELKRIQSFIRANRSGYINQIDATQLRRVFEQICQRVQITPEAQFKIFEEYYVGQFVLKDSELLNYVLDLSEHIEIEKLDEHDEKRLADCFEISNTRTKEQDIAYGIRQLVDIAIKAISPAVNDPTTAENCIVFLGDILVELSYRYPNRKRIDTGSDGNKGVYVKRLDWGGLIHLAFDQIIFFAKDDGKVLERIAISFFQMAQGLTIQDARPDIYRYALLKYLCGFSHHINEIKAKSVYTRPQSNFELSASYLKKGQELLVSQIHNQSLKQSAKQLMTTSTNLR